jgi:hypothetical protein
MIRYIKAYVEIPQWNTFVQFGMEPENLNRVDILTIQEYRNLKLTETIIRKVLR